MSGNKKNSIVTRKIWFNNVLSLFGQFIGLGLIILLFSLLEPKSFPTWFNFITVANQTVIIALAAMGMTFIIISGGIDLSVGSVIAVIDRQAWYYTVYSNTRHDGNCTGNCQMVFRAAESRCTDDMALGNNGAYAESKMDAGVTRCLDHDHFRGSYFRGS